MAEPKLNWIPHWDDRNENWLAPRLLPELEAATPESRSYSWRCPTLDQGNEGECVAFGLTEDAAARPVAVFGDPVRESLNITELNLTARRFFQAVRAIDRKEGRNFPEGATSLAGAKAGVEWGWWENYYWARSAEEIAFIIGRRGPVPVGTWVYESMFTARPGEDVTYKIGGRRRGGHLYLFTRNDAKRGRLWTPNSWGGWGQGWLEYETVNRLLREDGEGFIPVGRKKGLILPTQ